ncbi:hypothetical protein AN958_02674 [Leucoagaricus sp. SymC.cos]|nr:hypothetical protein AN958_02674 [Leucoagaricus sp. SymC.cos]
MRERGERDRHSGAFGSTRRTPGGGPQQQQSQSQGQAQQSEHAKLMVDSLVMFESQMTKLAPVLGAAGANHAEMLTRNAQTLVVNAERLNTMLKSGNSRALDAQIEAEVEGDYTSGSGSRESLADVWRKIGGEYREGVRVSDDLVRVVTGLLLGVGRVMKEYVHLQYGSQFGLEAGSVYGGGTPRGSPAVHGRSISLGEEDGRLRREGGVSPEAVGRERESRRSWEPAPSSGSGGGGVRSDSPLARASPAFHAVRELDRLETASPSLGASGLGLPKVNIPGGTRRLFAPSQQREMALVAENGQGDYEPSPTPASRTRAFDRADLAVPNIATQQQYQHSPLQQVREIPERSRTLTLPPQSQVFETPLRKHMTGGDGPGDSGEKVLSRDRDGRRKISVASVTTVRAGTSNTSTAVRSGSTTSSSGVSVPIHPGRPTLSTPSVATTAVTLDTGVTSAMSISRTPSHTSGSSSLYSTFTKPTFSRPEGILGLQQQLEGYRKRAENEGVPEGTSASSGTSNSGGGGAGDGIASGKGKNGNGGVPLMMTPESEREPRRKTLGVGSRIGARTSLDGVGGGGGSGDAGEFGERKKGRRAIVDLSVNAADRSAAATIGATARHERRRTVADIWP